MARRALELMVDELLDRRSVDVGDGTMRSRLICSSIAYDDHPDRVVGIMNAWDQLSQACHHHAYELVPSQNEIFGLVHRPPNLQAKVGRPISHGRRIPGKLGPWTRESMSRC